MADQLQQNQGLATTHVPATAPTPIATHPAASMVETMMSRGERDPRPVANVLTAHPDAQNEILAILHATAGNAFVNQVTATQQNLANDEPKAADVPLGPVRVTASALRIRSSPSTANKANIVGRLPRGTIVTVHKKDGDWFCIEHQGETCFIHGDYVASVAAPKPKVEKAGGDEDDGGMMHESNAAVAPPPTTPTPPAVPAENKADTAPLDNPFGDKPKADTPITPIEMPKSTDPKDAGPAVTPPTPAPDNVPAIPKNEAAPDKAQLASLTANYKGVFSHVYSTGSQKSQVWVSEGGVSATPNIYIHFHGHRTDHGIDPDLEWHEGGMKEGKDHKMHQVAPKEHRKNVDVKGSGFNAAQEAMAAAQGRNTVVILPQGVLGEGAGGVHEGGYMKDVEKLGLTGFIDAILKPLAKDLGVAALSPGNIGIGGHSSGGYTGVHSAMKDLGETGKGDKKKGKRDHGLMDKITDVTLYDASYSSAHLSDAREWMVHQNDDPAVQTPTKNLRLVNGWGQQTTNPKIDQTSHDLWFNAVGPDALKTLAAANHLKVKTLAHGAKLDKETTVMQHTQLVRADGSVQADVLILMYSQGEGDHEALRDRTIDDAIMSIGEGAAGNAKFGTHNKGKLLAENDALKHEGDAHADDKIADVLDAGTMHADTPIEKQTLPIPQHVEGEQKAEPEKVKEPPAVNAPSSRLQKAAKRHKGQAELFDKLYDEKTGMARLGKLGTHSEVDVQDKKTKKWNHVNIDLTPEQYEFKQKVYLKAIEEVGPGGLYGGVPKGNLVTIPGTSEKIRKEVLPDLTKMLQAAKDETGTHVTVSSGYRDIEEEVGIWNKAFDTIYLWDAIKEAKVKWPDDIYGPESVAATVTRIAPRKAVPGSSNHSNGIAVDLKPDGIKNAYKDQDAWRASKLYKWLNGKGDFKEKAAARFNFENWNKEAWHYDWRGKVDD